jgi:LacI family transcriptional regulator
MDHIPVASVEQFPYLQGQKATDILLDLLNQKNQELQGPPACYRITIESQLVENKKKTD